MSSNSSTSPSAAAQAVASVPARIVAAWADNDADAFAAACAEDATMILPGDVYLAGREQIRDYMKDAYSKQYKGTNVFGRPLGLRFLSDDVAVIVTWGGVVQAGNTEVTPEDAIRATWVVARYDDTWLVAAYQNTYVGTGSA